MASITIELACGSFIERSVEGTGESYSELVELFRDASVGLGFHHETVELYLGTPP